MLCALLLHGAPDSRVRRQCPLLAICNVLLLRGTLKLHPDIASITAAQLVQLVGNLIIESNATQVVAWLGAALVSSFRAP